MGCKQIMSERSGKELGEIETRRKRIGQEEFTVLGSTPVHLMCICISTGTKETDA